MVFFPYQYYVCFYVCEVVRSQSCTALGVVLFILVNSVPARNMLLVCSKLIQLLCLDGACNILEYPKRIGGELS
jgi:hypothetical protein